MPVARKSSVRAALAVVPMALAVVLGTAGVAHATYDDERATVHPGNVDAGQKDACEKAGLEGTPLKAGDLDFTGGKPNVDKYLTITGVADGVTVSGIVVKGGDKYNVYVPGEKGLSDVPPWEKLQSPLNGGHKVPQISHWFACGTVTVPTTSTSTTTTSTTDSSTTAPPESSSTEPSESTPGTSAESSTPASTSTSGGATTTSTPAAVPVENASDNDDLASTGFGSGWLLWVGGLLVLGGAAVLVLLRIRRNA